MTRELKRLLVWGGPPVWLMVGVPALVRRAHEPWRIATWLCAYLAFAALFALALWRPRRLLLIPQALAVVGVVLAMCDGFEGALLVLVALQWGGLASRRLGLAAVGLQSAALAAAVGWHWSPSAALLLAPPYLGFQLLALFAAAGMRQLAEAQGAVLENERLSERLRISRELHDRMGHHLTALNLNLDAASKGHSADALAAAREVARSLMAQIRAAVDELREPERLDVCTALRALAEELRAPRLHLTAPESLPLRDPRQALVLIRCAQEICTNAARHAGAENLWIELSHGGRGIELTARDDGRGAREVLPGNGLRGMRERVESIGGSLEIQSGEGAGFQVRATLPARGAV